MRGLILTISIFIALLSFGQSNCGIRVLITLNDVPKVVLFDNGKIIFKVDDKSPIYFKDSLTNIEKNNFISELHLDTTYYYSRKSFTNRLCDDCGQELLFYTNVNDRKQTHIIYNYDTKYLDTIPKSLIPLYVRAFNYNSISKILYVAPKILVCLISIDKKEIKKHVKKNSWTFDWKNYENSNINSVYPNTPMLLIDFKYFDEVVQKRKTNIVSFNGKLFRVLSVRPYIENEQCFGEKRYFLKN